MNRLNGCRAALAVLLALLAVGFAADGIQPWHSHEDGRLGLYNAECPLAELAAVHSEGWVPGSLKVASPTRVVVLVAIPSSGRAPSPSPSLTDSRAPPLA
jgi:hypothetical protein